MTAGIDYSGVPWYFYVVRGKKASPYCKKPITVKQGRSDTPGILTSAPALFTLNLRFKQAFCPGPLSSGSRKENRTGTMIKADENTPVRSREESHDILWNLLPIPPRETAPPAKFYEPGSFLISKLRDHDIVLLGANHSRNSSLEIVCDILPPVSRLGVRFVGLEIASDQQSALDAYIRQGTGLHDIEISPIIACPEYRNFLECIRSADLRPVALDLPRSMWPTSWRRDEWMAEKIAGVLREHPGGKMLVVVGNLHTLKSVRWTDPENQNMFIPGYLCRTDPNLRLCSILTEHTEAPKRKNGSAAAAGERMPLAVDLRGLDLELRIQNLLAVRKMNPEEMADGLILF